MKTIIIQTVLVCIVVLLFGTLAFAVDELTVLMQKPVKVSTKHIDGDIPNHYQFELHIKHSSSHFKFNTEIQSDSLAAALNSQKESVRWKEPYLLIGWERGGGNAARGYLDAVFMLHKGKLLYLGEVDADSFENEVFKDWYDKFELNSLTSHAEAPLIKLVIEEKSGRLVVNLEKTWTENQKRFNDNKGIIKYIQTKEKMKSESRVRQLYGPLLFNTILGKYCKHEKETISFDEIAKNELDKESLKLFNDILSRVIPGELPKARIEFN